jgi:hypothetical protein
MDIQPATKNFDHICRKLKIPPPQVPVREKDHMNGCGLCQQVWPLFYYEECVVKCAEFKEICQNWMNMTENTRKKLFCKLSMDEKKWMKSMIKGRSLTGYQLFLRESSHRQKETNPVSFGVRTKYLAEKWQQLSSTEKQTYNNLSSMKKKERLQFLQRLPKFKKVKLKLEKKSYFAKRKRFGRPINVFMSYLKDRWNDEKRKSAGVKYRELMKIASREWSNLDPAVKDSYYKQFNQQKENGSLCNTNRVDIVRRQQNLNSDSD